MPTIIMIEHNGTRHELQAKAGESVMHAVVENMVPGLLADCGGACSCATCHAYVEPAWRDALPAPSEDEAMMLDGVLEQRDTSRLTCQVIVTDAMEGLQFQLPASQC
ncbi:2Fe-2S iron-sulfur cluster-binding protein [Pseudomonas sp. M47T1]|uniref:2Fe-2S iron-sulfur cluster-binding protein n=1 Tax=Pseudomonas sp. M47T1 TaxID=1179778 RepID=UPI0002F36708|nr:2Fe-2S iron-sulfur cluster-binding protein [Pseudomonas sp. M47T1]